MDWNFGTNGRNDPRYHFLSDPTFSYFADVASVRINVRMAFLRKVYGILSVQLLSTILVCTGFMLNAEWVKGALMADGAMLGLILICTLGLAAIGLLFALQWKAHEIPLNFVLLAAFTLCESVTVGLCVIQFELGTVLQAAALTLLVTTCLTLYSLQSKRDFSEWEAALFSGLVALLGGLTLQMFLPSSSLLEFCVTFGGALLFCLFIVFDTARIANKVSAEDYILASVDLYLDVINLFIYMLRIFGAPKRE